MNLLLTRTPRSKGVIYEAADRAGKKVLTVDLEICGRKVWKVQLHEEWILRFQQENRVTQAVMRMDSMAAEFQAEDGQLRGRLREAHLSIAGKVLVEDENEQRLGSISFSLAKVHFKDSHNRRIGLARQTISKMKLGFIPPSKAHTFWDYEVEIEDSAYDERLLYALVCVLVTSEFASSGS